MFLLFVLSVSALAIVVLFTVGNGYHRLTGNQSNTILSQSAGLDAVRDERCVTPIKYLASFGFCFVYVPFKKHLRILFYGRYSKDEQRKFSIDDQLLYCKEFLSDLGVDVSSLDELYDRGTSGEHHSRPGIDQVRQGIEKRKWDLIICEDSSRLFRSISPCMNLVGTAVDNEIRIICINDRVDTANDDWQHRLEDAQKHHGQDNYLTRYRIKRTQDGLWATGAAMGPLRPGYERYLSNPENHKDPKYDRIDQKWVETIRTAFQMVADDLPLDAVARYLTEQGLPKNSNAEIDEWSDRNVLTMMRCPIYRGEEKYRVRISRKRHTTGRSELIRNPNPQKILTRKMPHLRIVEDWVWHQANRAIDERSTNKDPVFGIDHPLYRVPRDSRSPLSNVFICGICGNKMYMEGRNEGGFRCSASRRDGCWNRATALRDFAYRQIGVGISEAILRSSETILDPLTDYTERLLLTPKNIEQLRTQLNRRRTELKRQQNNLLKLVMDSDKSPEFVVEKAKEIQSQLDELKYDEERLQSQLSQARSLPTRDEIAAKFLEAAEQILSMDRIAGDVLERILKGPIRAVPCQQLGSNKVVLRAEMTLQLVKFGGRGLSLQLPSEEELTADPEVYEEKVTVDLFEASSAPANAMLALEYYDRDPDHRPTLEEIGAHLGISKRAAHLALKMGKQLQERGLTEPFIPLTEAPENASRWRPKQTA